MRVRRRRPPVPSLMRATVVTVGRAGGAPSGG